jgi:hypothetical protein
VTFREVVRGALDGVEVAQVDAQDLDDAGWRELSDARFGVGGSLRVPAAEHHMGAVRGQRSSGFDAAVGARDQHHAPAPVSDVGLGPLR